MKWTRLAALVAAPLALQGCLLTPAEFTAAMDVRADRGFTFTYVGTVRAIDLKQIGDEIGKSMGKADDKDAIEDFEPTRTAMSLQPVEEADDADDKTDFLKALAPLTTDESKRALAETLAKEKGFRRITYRGDNLFDVDYAITGRLDHGFVWPVNLDAEQMVPFLMAEVRANGAVRIKAPGFAKSPQRADLSALLSEGDGIKGRFTITSDVPFTASNQEEGATRVGARHQVAWTITPMTAEAPSATLALAP